MAWEDYEAMRERLERLRAEQERGVTTLRA